VIGGGVEIVGSNTATGVTASVPIDGMDHDQKPDDGWRGSAGSRSAADKAIVAYATCAKKGKFSYVSQSFTLDPHDGLETALGCPGSTVGGGVALQRSNRTLAIGQSSPWDLNADGKEDDGWITYVTNGGDVPTTVTQHLICATNDDYSYVSNTVDSFNGTQTKVNANCPGRADVVSGGGEILVSGLVEMAGIYPADLAHDGKADEGWTLRMNNSVGDNDRDATVYAICG
jgi:hypothetical protein